MKKLLHTIALLLFFTNLAYANMKPSELNSIFFTDQEAFFIGQQLGYYIEKNSNLTIHQIQTEFQNGHFTKYDYPVFAKPASKNSYWFTYKINAIYDEMIWMHINDCSLDSVEIFVVNIDGEVVKHHLSGSRFNKDLRYYDNSTTWFPIIEKNDIEDYQVYIKVYSIAMMEVPIKVGSFISLVKSVRFFSFVSVFFVGALILMSIYYLFIFLFSREMVYLYYSGYIFTIMVTVTFLNNFPQISEFLLGLKITYTYTLIWISPSFILIGLLFITYFNIKDKFPSIYRMYIIEIFFFILISLSNLIFSGSFFLTNIYEIAIGAVLITSILSCYLCWDPSQLDHVLFTIGWTIMGVSSGVYLLVANGILPYSFFLRNSMYFGVLFEIILFSIALAKRLNDLEHDLKNANSQLLEKNDELIQNNESLDMFTYHVSHDLKTILANSYSLARMAEKYSSKNNPGKLADIISRLLTITHNGMETVKSFITIGTYNNKMMEDEVTTFNITDLITTMVEDNNLSGSIELEYSNEDIANISIQKKVIETIFLNFITNSIKYNEKPPMAWINFIKDDKSLTIIYKDNGIGMDMVKDGHKLFVAFVRINPDPKKEGSGIGLFLVKKLIQRFSGTIEADSQPGEGMTFTVVLPLKHM